MFRRVIRKSGLPTQRAAGVLGRAVRASTRAMLQPMYTCERLEPRRMLIVLSGGGMAGSVPQESTFEYLDAAMNTERIALWGNIDVVAVFSRVNGTNRPELSNAVRPSATPPQYGTDLFELYILDAQPGASISIGEVPPITSFPRPMEATTGSVGSIRSINNVTDTYTLIPLDSGTGSVYIGARLLAPTTGSTDTVSDIPILSIADTHLHDSDALAGLPDPKDGKVLAGIYTAPNVSLNRLFIGGTITGNVSIGGSVDTFYAGNVLTGLAPAVFISGVDYGDGLGSAEIVPQSIAHNFYVGGDLGQLDVSGTIGTDASVQTSDTTPGGAGPDKPAFITGFQLYVGGHLGAVNCSTSIVGSVKVINASGDKNTGFAQTKSALPGNPIDPTVSSETYFEGNAPQDFGVPSLYDASTSLINLFGNGYFGSAQYLGTPYYTPLGFKTSTVDGFLQGDDGLANDYADWYAVPLLAGQTITATLALPDLAHNPSLAAIAANLAENNGYTAAQLNQFLELEFDQLRLAAFNPEVIKTTEAAGGGSGSNGGLDVNPLSMIASTYTYTTGTVSPDSFKFTAQQPGTYYFAVAYNGDINFNGAVNTGDGITQDPETNFLDDGFAAYQLEIQGVGNLGVGGVTARNSIDTPYIVDPTLPESDSPSIYVQNGDLGAVAVPGSETIGSDGTISAGTSPPGGVLATSPYQSIKSDFQTNNLVVAPYTVVAGNLRVLDAAGIGYTAQETSTVPSGSSGFTTVQSVYIRSAPDIDVPFGSVGLVRTTNPDDALGLNIGHTFPTFGISQDEYPAPDIAPVGGSYQLIDAAGNLTANLKAAKSIGVVRMNGTGGAVPTGAGLTGAGTFQDPGSFQINSSGKPEGGVIDLIDDAGDWGDFTGGGPALLDGPGGNIHYLQVARVTYRDRYFGGGVQELPVVAAAGKSVALIDDSGTHFTITPVQTGQFLDSSGTLQSNGTGGQIGVLTYPVRDSGGVVVENVTANSSFNTQGVNVGGVTITASASGKNGGVEIGQLFVEGDGTDTTYDETTGKFTTGTNTAALPVVLRGNVPVSVYNLSSATANSIDPSIGATTADANTGFSKVENDTTGEIVNIEASSINTLSGQAVGLAHSSTGGNFVGGFKVLSQAFPFNLQRNLIDITGSVKTISSRSGLGNILVQGVIGTLQADTSNKFATNSSQVFAGIDAPVYAQTTTTTNTNGDILNVQIGQGVLSAGTGDHPAAGLFADNYIGTVNNQGAGSDIHGPIVAAANINFDLPGGEPLYTTNFTTGAVTPVPNSTTVIRSINLKDGAILGGAIMVSRLTDSLTIAKQYVLPSVEDFATLDTAPSIMSISSTGKDAGILGAQIGATNIQSITTSGGFGMVNTRVEQTPQSILNTVSADGYGIRNSVFDGGVNTGSITAVGSGKLLNVTAFNSLARQSLAGSSYDSFSGEILTPDNDLGHTLGLTKAKPKRVGYSESGVISGSLFTGGQSLSSMTAWRLGSPATKASANRISFGLTIGSIKVADSMYYTKVNTGGLTLAQINHYMQASSLNVSGPIGTLNLGNVKVNSTINATGSDGTINTVNVSGQYLGTLTAFVSIGTIDSTGNLGSPNLNVEGSLGSLIVSKNVLPSADIRVVGTLKNLLVKKDFEGTLYAKVITNQEIRGSTTGTITTG